MVVKKQKKGEGQERGQQAGTYRMTGGRRLKSVRGLQQCAPNWVKSMQTCHSESHISSLHKLHVSAVQAAVT